MGLWAVMVLEAVDMLHEQICFLIKAPFGQVVFFELPSQQPQYLSTLQLHAFHLLLSIMIRFRGSYCHKDFLSLSIKNKALSVLIPYSKTSHIDSFFEFDLSLGFTLNNRHETQVCILRKRYFRIKQLENFHDLLHDRLFKALRDHFPMRKDLRSLFLAVEQNNSATAVGESADGL